MKDTRQKDGAWEIKTDAMGMFSWPQVTVAVLMDVRDELKRINSALYCPNALAIPEMLRQIKNNTKRRRAKRKGRR